MSGKGERFDYLSVSSSGLHYVREKRGGVMRVLTDAELADFQDPPPCPECAEQFGCDHRNSAGEPMLTDAEIEESVPAQWKELARDRGLSRGDIERLRLVEWNAAENEFRVSPGVSADLRTLEIVLQLNER